MRIVIGVIFAAILASSVASGQGSTENSGEFTDPAGDARPPSFPAHYADAPQASAGWRAVDLRSLEINETDLSMIINIETEGANLFGRVGYEVTFTWSGRAHKISIEDITGTGLEASLSHESTVSLDGWENVGTLEGSFDEPAGAVQVVLPKYFIVDDDHRPPLQGSRLDDLVVRSWWDVSVDFESSGPVEDRLPDVGVLSYTIRLGSTRGASLSAYSPAPLRMSNGGAETFSYVVFLRNDRDVPRNLEVRSEGLPQKWVVTIDGPVRVPPQSEVSTTVLVSIPFAHVHGGYNAVRLVVRDAEDPEDVASTLLGVLHTPIPQPAGHHNALWLHATPNGPASVARHDFWMSTVSDHAGDGDRAAAPQHVDGEWSWVIPLNPDLEIGLDFDLKGAGEIVGSLIGPTIGNAEIDAQLLIVGDFDRDGVGLVLATATPTTVSMNATLSTPFRLALTPTGDADRVPIFPSRNLALRIQLRPEVSPAINDFAWLEEVSPALVVEDFRISLPLNDYHEALVVENGIQLASVDDSEVAGAAGVAAEHHLLLTSSRGTLTVDVELYGTHANLARLLPSGPYVVEPGMSTPMTLQFDVPAESGVGQVFEIVLRAKAREAPDAVGILSISTTVEESVEVPGSTIASDSEERNVAPAGMIFIALGAVAGFVWIIRHRT